MNIHWNEIEAWAKKKMDTARNLNDDTKLTEQQTAALRGRIAVLKELLALPELKRQDARAVNDDPA
jgi:hypothetical protein